MTGIDNDRAISPAPNVAKELAEGDGLAGTRAGANQAVQRLDVGWHWQTAKAHQAVPGGLVTDQVHTGVSNCLCLGQLTILFTCVIEDETDIDTAWLDSGQRAFVPPTSAIVGRVERSGDQGGGEGRHVDASDEGGPAHVTTGDSRLRRSG